MNGQAMISKVLSVNTATGSCSVAIVENDRILVELFLDNGQTHAKYLMEMIERSLVLAQFSIAELDGLAVTTGPGTFTGLRIGISSIKGMAAAGSKPVAGISSLETLATQASLYPGLIYPMLDARRGEVYGAQYRRENGSLIESGGHRVTSIETAICHISEPTLFLGTGAMLYRAAIRSHLGDLAYFPPSGDDRIRASTVAFLGLEKLRNGELPDAGYLVPNYIRKSDAELNRPAGDNSGVFPGVKSRI
jgi:tRNA threonylcarbamoyladenosine biosynthesis protein TsaB